MARLSSSSRRTATRKCACRHVPSRSFSYCRLIRAVLLKWLAFSMRFTISDPSRHGLRRDGAGNSFMSGRRPDTTRVFNDGIGAHDFRVTGPVSVISLCVGPCQVVMHVADVTHAQNWTSLPQAFKEAGYFTTGVGKSFHPNSPPNFDQPLSWTESINGSTGK